MKTHTTDDYGTHTKWHDPENEIEKLRAQRDELLAAAKAVMADTTQSKEPFPSAIVRQSSIAKLKTAIANCE